MITAGPSGCQTRPQMPKLVILDSSPRAHYICIESEHPVSWHGDHIWASKYNQYPTRRTDLPPLRHRVFNKAENIHQKEASTLRLPEDSD